MRISIPSRLFLAVAILALAGFMPSAQAQNVNWIQETGATTGNSPTINARGSDSNVNLTLTPQGTGNILIPTGSVGIGSSVPALSLDLSQKTDGIAIPSGSTGQRSASPKAGTIRYNTTTPAIEAYIGTSWSTLVAGNTPSGGTPAAITFTNVTGASTGASVTSNAVTLSGYTGTVTATCSGCTAIVRNGTSGGTTVTGFAAGDTIAITVTASSSLGTAVTATAQVGPTVSSTWSVTTTTSTPTAFSFTNVTGANTSTTTYSNAVTLSGFTGSLTATCNTGCTAIAKGGVWGGTSMTGFTSGSTIQIAQLSSSSALTATTASVTVGNTTSSAWSVTTYADPCPGVTTPGTACPDGTVFAGISPDTTQGNNRMFTTPCDLGMTYSSGSCTGTASTYTFNNGTSSGGTATGYTSGVTGKANTAGLYSLSGGDAPYKAADACVALTADGYSDWYLPADQELDNIASYASSISGIATASYWSSTASTADAAWDVNITTSNNSYSNGYYNINPISANSSYRVRCVRRQ